MFVAASASSILTILLKTKTSVEFSGLGQIFKTGVVNLSRKNCDGLALVSLLGMFKYSDLLNLVICKSVVTVPSTLLNEQSRTSIMFEFKV